MSVGVFYVSVGLFSLLARLVPLALFRDDDALLRDVLGLCDALG